MNYLAGLDSSMPEGRRRRGSRDSKWPIACASGNEPEAHSSSDYSLDGFGEDITTTDEDNDGDDDDDGDEDDDDSSSLSMSAVAIPMY